MNKSPLFELIEFAPVGIKKIVYPNKFCTLCKGDLNETCIDCRNTTKICQVELLDTTYCHVHCKKYIAK